LGERAGRQTSPPLPRAPLRRRRGAVDDEALVDCAGAWDPSPLAHFGVAQDMLSAGERGSRWWPVGPGWRRRTLQDESRSFVVGALPSPAGAAAFRELEGGRPLSGDGEGLETERAVDGVALVDWVGAWNPLPNPLPSGERGRCWWRVTRRTLESLGGVRVRGCVGLWRVLLWA